MIRMIKLNWPLKATSLTVNHAKHDSYFYGMVSFLLCFRDKEREPAGWLVRWYDKVIDMIFDLLLDDTLYAELELELIKEFNGRWEKINTVLKKYRRKSYLYYLYIINLMISCRILIPARSAACKRALLSTWLK